MKPQSNTDKRLLFITKRFRQGSGGAPESVRLAAKLLKAVDVICDVRDSYDFFADVGSLETLPEMRAPSDGVGLGLQRYEALLNVGPWNHPRVLFDALRSKPSQVPFIYLPRGGLARDEFGRFRDLKKFPYLALLERLWLRRANAIVYSSRLEANATASYVRRNSNAEFVIPDFYSDLENSDRGATSSNALRFSFLAEIHPKKGLVELLDGISGWLQRRSPEHELRVTIAGAPRRGCETYFKDAMDRINCSPFASNFEFVGALPHQGRSDFYSSADVFVIPSRLDSFGLTLLEALGAGCVVLTSNNLGALEYIPQSQDLIVLRDLSVESFVSGMDLAYARALQRRNSIRRKIDGLANTINTVAAGRWSDLWKSLGLDALAERFHALSFLDETGASSRVGPVSTASI